MQDSPPHLIRHRFLVGLVWLVFCYVLIVNAWVVDDAYITFRTVDNFVNGYGLTWNVDERVQVYTHPLWMFLMALGYLFTGEVFWTCLVLSFVLTVTAVWVLAARMPRREGWRVALLLLAFLASKAVIDYASSGLENALSYLLAAVFFTTLATRQKVHYQRASQFGFFVLVASLAFFNRMDTLLLYVPALLWLMFRFRRVGLVRLLATLGVGTLPATLWVVFAVWYYGTPFPNTAYAKVFAVDYPFMWKLRCGLEYLANSLVWDTASWLMLLGACVWYCRERCAAARTALAGVALYLAFVVVSAGSATHMSGRFFAVPMFLGLWIFVKGLPSSRWPGLVAGMLVVYMAVHPLAALKFGTPAYLVLEQPRNAIDTKWYVMEEGAALVNWRWGLRMPAHSWYHFGEQLRKEKRRVHVGGAFGGDPIGYVGFAAGPEVFLIDRLALSDPLLARLPPLPPDVPGQFRAGHPRRALPKGYVESVATGKNMVYDKKLRRYYEKLRIITRGSLLSVNRLEVIWRMNIGRYQELLPACQD